MLSLQIDLKHYKSRRLALRWRTAPEVVEGIGEDTCGSLRCKYHQPFTLVPDRVDFYEDSDANDNREHGGWDDVNERSDRLGSKRRRKSKPPPQLRAFELPFAYEEAGERKEAMVKVRLCPRCQGKLTWKPGKDIEDWSGDEAEEPQRRDNADGRGDRRRNEGGSDEKDHGLRRDRDRKHRARLDRSRSPRRRKPRHEVDDA